MSLHLEELVSKLANLNQQKSMAEQTFHQIVGAITIVEDLVKRLKEDLNNKPVENNDGEVNNQGA